jgi:hypothetical protein
MPVLRQDNVLELWSDSMYEIDHGVAVGDGKRPAGAEIVL